jgi:hypothetical protein
MGKVNLVNVTTSYHCLLCVFEVENYNISGFEANKLSMYPKQTVHLLCEQFCFTDIPEQRSLWAVMPSKSPEWSKVTHCDKSSNSLFYLLTFPLRSYFNVQVGATVHLSTLPVLLKRLSKTEIRLPVLCQLCDSISEQGTRYSHYGIPWFLSSVKEVTTDSLLSPLYTSVSRLSWNK